MKTSTLILILALISMAGCREAIDIPPSEVQKVHLPSHHYNYISEVPPLRFHQKVYVPIYSDIYTINGQRKYSLTATLSVRNTSLKDSLYLNKVDYYDSKGKVIRKYIHRVVLLKPLESLEFIVDYNEVEGGAGANFIVDWGSTATHLHPLFQAVMIGTTDQQGISFVTEGVEVRE